MAVMEGVAFEQKPVPSSETVLDLDVNGNSNLDQQDLNLDATASAPASKAPDSSPSLNFTSASTELNGTSHNMEAFASNQTIAAPIDLPVESQATDATSSSLDQQPSQLPDHHTFTTSDSQQDLPETPSASAIVSGEPEFAVAPAIESATEIEITSALQDTAASSSVLPVVEAQESDIRDTTSHLALSTQPETQTTSAIDSELQPSTTTMESMFGDGPSSGQISPDPLPASDGSPHLATKTETMTLDAPIEATDSIMADAPESSTFTKVAREREDDDDAEPTAKRTKVDEEDTAMADIPTQEEKAAEVPPVVQTNDVAPASSAPVPISAHEAKEIINKLKNLARTKDGMNFKKPVGELWPTLTATYNEKISNPIDFQTMETKLKESQYASMDDFKADVDLLVDNSIAYNGNVHVVTDSAQRIRDNIFAKITNMPPEPVVAPKPLKQARQSTPRVESASRTTPNRRKSKSLGTGPAIPPAPTFALDPATNTPLIRRDSTKNDAGRPKREIHPPKNKDLPYNTTRPKGRKAATELRYVDHVLAEMKKAKHSAYSWPFMTPVDPVSMGIPAYFSIIKHPMDISKIESKTKDGEISSAKQFESDMKLMFSNCYKFNPADNDIHKMGKRFEEVFNELWADKNQWIADHAPAAQTPSTAGSEEEDDESEQEVDDGTDQAALAQLSQRLNEEQEKLIILMESKDAKNEQAIELQRDMIDLVKTKIAAAKKSAPKKTVKKPKTARAPKKAAAIKKAVGGPKKAAKPKHMGTTEKHVISIGIGRLPDAITSDVLALIKAETAVDDANGEGEVELDIDSISPAVLWQIYAHVIDHVPGITAEAEASMEDQVPAVSTPAKPAAKKKNKPMSKGEQERKIQLLENTIGDFERNSSASQEPVPTVEDAGNESSGDEDESEEED